MPRTSQSDEPYGTRNNPPEDDNTRWEQLRIRMTRGAALSAASWALSMLTVLPLTILLVRCMTATAYGVLVLSVTLSSLLTMLAASGLRVAVNRYGTVALGSHGIDGLRIFTARSFGFAVYLAAASIIVQAVIGLLIWNYGGRSLAESLWALIPLVALAPFAGVITGVCETTIQAASMAASAVTNSVVMLVGSVTLIGFGYSGSVGLAAIRSLSAAASLIVMLPNFKRTLYKGGATEEGGLASTDSYLPPKGSTVLFFSGSVLLVGSLGFAISNLDILTLGLIKGTAIVGNYSPASRMADVVLGIPVMLSSFLLTGLSSAQENRPDLVRLFRWSSISAFAVALPAISVMAGAAPAVLSLLFGRNPASVVVSTEMLGLTAAAAALLGYNTLALAALGDTFSLTTLSCVGLFANVVACVALIPMLGMVGAAAATGIGIVASNVAATALLKRRHDVALGLSQTLQAAGICGLSIALAALTRHLPVSAPLAVAVALFTSSALALVIGANAWRRLRPGRSAYSRDLNNCGGSDVRVS